MIAPQSLPPGGFIGNKKNIPKQYIPQKTNSQNGSFFYYTGSAPPSNLAPTVKGPGVSWYR